MVSNAPTPSPRRPRAAASAPRIRQIPVSKLVPRDRNARTHSNEQVGLIAKAIETLGFLDPVIVGRGNVIMAGHGRVLAAKQLGLRTVPCVVHEHLTKAQERLHVLASNRLAELAGWDQDLLGLELGELRGLGLDLGIIGFSLGEIDTSIARALRTITGKTDPDAVPEPAPGPAASRRGDVWALGAHRLACGDSTNRDAVGALLQGRKAPRLMVTDPPYGVEYDPAWRKRSGLAGPGLAEGKVRNDDVADWREAWALFGGDVAYVWHAGTRAHLVAGGLAAMGFQIRAQIIWVKARFAISRGAYHHQHEPAFYAVREGADDHWSGAQDVEGAPAASRALTSPSRDEGSPFDRFGLDHATALYAVREGATAGWEGGRKQSTVWSIDHVRNDTGHGTQKPVDCMKRPIENNSKPGDTVYEPFSGSGTTLIAAEMTGRACLAMELDPAYVDLGVRRWQEFTGRTAVEESSGRSFAEISAERLAPAAG